MLVVVGGVVFDSIVPSETTIVRRRRWQGGVNRREQATNTLSASALATIHQTATFAKEVRLH